MKKLFAILSILALGVVSCKSPDNPQQMVDAPVLVSTAPGDGVTGVTGKTFTVVFAFDQRVKCTQESQAKISVDGGASIESIVVKGAGITITVADLERGKTYTISIPNGAVEGIKENQKAVGAIAYHFTTKEPGVPASWDDDAAAVARKMGTGWNLGNTLESNSADVDNMWIEAFTGRKTSDYETAWGQPVTTPELIHMFKEAGFNSIRVPVTWYPHMGTVSVTVSDDKGVWDMSTWTGYDIDPAWMARVKEVVGYVLDEDMYCILNVHHDTGTASTAWLRADKTVHANVQERYCELWKQIATEFESYGPRLVFESFNEMLDTKGTWNASTKDAHEAINLYNADFVATVRATGGNNAKRVLILNTYAASCQPEALKDFQIPEDSVPGRLMAEVHSYAPYRFAFNPGEGETWTPITTFDAACEKEVKGLVENMNTYLVSKGIPCVLGEYGADLRNGSARRDEELGKQAACYVSAAAQYNIPCFYWMTLSEGSDRTVPKWTKAVIRDAIINAYNQNAQ